MPKKVAIVTLLVIALIAVAGAANLTRWWLLRQPPFPYSDSMRGCRKEVTRKDIQKAVQIAMEFVRNSPTYIFDGSNLEHVKTEVIRFPIMPEAFDCGTSSILKFISSFAGYGNRSGQDLIKGPVVHTIEVIILDGQVIRAVIDGKWDEINQRPYIYP